VTKYKAEASAFMLSYPLRYSSKCASCIHSFIYSCTYKYRCCIKQVGVRSSPYIVKIGIQKRTDAKNPICTFLSLKSMENFFFGTGAEGADFFLVLLATGAFLFSPPPRMSATDCNCMPVSFVLGTNARVAEDTNRWEQSSRSKKADTFMVMVSWLLVRSDV
jgi:hypothetical protein